MKSLDRKLLRDFHRSQGLLVAITLIISVGVMCYVTMQSAYHNLHDAKTRYYRQCRMADFWIEVKKVPTAELATLGRMTGVAQLDSRIQFYATVDIEGTIKPINGLVASLPDRRSLLINDIVLQQGDYFSDRRENEVILSEKFARTHRIYPGDTIHLLLNNRRQELVVAGTAISSEFTYLLGPGAILPDPASFGVFYVKQSFAEDVFDFEGAVNQITGRISPGAAGEVDVVLEQMENHLDTFGVFSAYPLKTQPSNQYLTNEIDGLKAFATMIPTIFLAVAALILNVLVSRLVRQQRTTIGTLKALGYSNSVVFTHYLKFGLTVGVIGSLIGSFVGYWLAEGMTIVYRQYFEFPDLTNRFHWYTHAVGLSSSVACAVAGSLHAARTALSLHPAEAMRPAPPKSGGAIWLERVSWFWNRLKASWRVTLRGLVRNKLRSGVAIFASSMGAGLLVCGFMLVEAQNFLINFQFQSITRSDIDLTFTNEVAREAIYEVSQLPGVDLVEPTLNVACTLVNGSKKKKIGIQGLSRTATLTIPRDTSNHRILIPEVGIILERKLAEELQVGAGSMVTIIPVKGEKRPVRVPVAKLADSYLGLSVYADIEYLSHLVGEDFVMTGAQLSTRHDSDSLRALYTDLKQMPGVQSINDRRALIQTLIDTLLQNQLVMIGTIIMFAAVIFLGSIINASIVSLAERQREVATYRALGYTEWHVGMMFLREAICTNSIGTLLGLPFGYLLVWGLVVSYSNDLIRMPLVTSPWIWFTTIAMAIVFVVVAHGIVQWTINKMDYLESLKIKE